MQTLQKKWLKAAEYYVASLNVDPDYPEALYNLALVKSKSGEIDAAITILERCIILEEDDGWRRAARNLQQKLQGENNLNTKQN